MVEEKTTGHLCEKFNISEIQTFVESSILGLHSKRSKKDDVAVPSKADFFRRITTTEKCRQNTHSHDTFVHVQLITESSAQVQSLTTRTRVAQGPTRLRIAHCGVSKKISSSQRHVSDVAAVVTEHFYTISFTPLELDQETLREPRRSGGSTKSASPRRRRRTKTKHTKS